MFTGIIKEIGKISAIRLFDGSREMTITCKLANKLEIDESISVNGVCHTVTEVGKFSFDVQSVEETLRKTAIGELTKGDEVNLERALRADQHLDGHMVQGHVDGTGRILSIKQTGNDRLLTVDYPERFRNLVVPRGSITIDGISLTVAREEDTRFTVAVIPYTFQHTTMKNRVVGGRVNLEFDILGKYVVRYLEDSR
jgi:riboflavin synthase